MTGRLYCDGGARGNPGPAGAAAVLTDEQGENLGTAYNYLGIATNNVAEYQGLLLGIRLAKKKGIRRLSIHLDSELVTRQLTGQYKVKHPGLLPLWEKCRQELRELAFWEVRHIPREANSAADALVNRAIDQQAGQE